MVKALKAILGPEEAILVSHDRWCLYRPTEVGGGKPTRNNLHLDLHPWSGWDLMMGGVDDDTQRKKKDMKGKGMERIQMD